MIRAERRLGAWMLLVFAAQLLVVQAHLAHEHHETTTAVHDDVGHLPFHGGDEHDELDHVLPYLVTPRGPHATGHDLGLLALAPATHELAQPRAVAWPRLDDELALREASPPRGPRARAPPVA